MMLLVLALVALVSASTPFRGPGDCAAICAHGGDTLHADTWCTFYTGRQQCETSCGKCTHGSKAAINCASECYTLAAKTLEQQKAGGAAKRNVDAVREHRECNERCNRSFFCECTAPLETIE
eukprot:TRINITY_DN3_c0_g1_i1.p2 TRINITY_DN3_c0_g1~~TRINITY_DN3_c0_g1_i1.p2  ORF type:complete len:122 (-),score=49.75 TRINITY_DN3_c0_g1_i1:97-462(-)